MSDDVIYGEPIETREPTYKDGYTKAIYQTKNIIDNLKKENERLNNIIKKAIHFINLNQDEKKLTLNYDDLKKLRGILNNDDYYLTLFEEQLKELKEMNKR